MYTDTFTVELDKFELEGGELVAEASTLGLKPGQWPVAILVGGETYYTPTPNADGSIVRYRSTNGYVAIFND